MGLHRDNPDESSVSGGKVAEEIGNSEGGGTGIRRIYREDPKLHTHSV